MTQEDAKNPYRIGTPIGRCAAFRAAFRRGGGVVGWPDRILGPRPGLKEITLICWCLFVACLVVPLSVAFVLHLKAGSLGDFVYFYGIGHLANQHSASKLYDYGLQLKIFNQTEPLLDGTWGPSPYPPFVALFFSPFARLPFKFAYLLWLGISLALFCVGIMGIIKGTFPHERLKGSLAFCLALAYPPFLMNTLMNGQLASVAVCSVGLAIALEKKSRPILSGLALSVLMYKPTLLILLLPMLLLTRRLKTIVGFVIGTVILSPGFDSVDGGSGLAGVWKLSTTIWTAFPNRRPVSASALAIRGFELIFILCSRRTIESWIDHPDQRDGDCGGLACNALVEVLRR